MIQQDNEIDQNKQIEEYYYDIEREIEDKLKNFTTETLDSIKGKLKRKQNKEDQEQNINLIERQRYKIKEEMKEHIKTCYHPECIHVQEITIKYNLFKGARQTQKQDVLTLVVRPFVNGIPKKQTNCYHGQKLNAKMWESHRMIAAM